MVPKIADWSGIAGVFVGLASLLYSFRAFKAAKKAKQSADDARHDVRTLVAADRFHYLSSRASELFNNIEHENLPVAVFLATDLRFEINGAVTRWEFLDPETRVRFREASLLTRQVAEFMRSKNQLDPRDKAKVLRKCDSVRAILSGESVKYRLDWKSGVNYEGREVRSFRVPSNYSKAIGENQAGARPMAGWFEHLLLQARLGNLERNQVHSLQQRNSRHQLRHALPGHGGPQWKRTISRRVQ